MKGKEYYMSFWTALNHYGLTEQIPVTVQIVAKTQERSFKALQSSFEFTKVRKLGHWQEEKIGDKSIRFATMEQLICDCLTLPEKSGGVKEAAKALWNAREKINWKTIQTLEVTDATWRRLGYLCELLGIKNIKVKKFIGWRWLDPSSTKKIISKSKKWGLLLNISEKELTEWRMY
jgi:predicted transcriptional regulator of viral defense system